MPSSISSTGAVNATFFKQRLNIQLHKLYRQGRRVKKKEGRKKTMKRKMEIKNLKLMMANQSIIKENEKLREKAIQLHQENKALLSQLQKVPLLQLPS
ncbi:hypothetical protein NMG60_11029128 [Bertholletia excelsa]